jgi:hypothetical protein
VLGDAGEVGHHAARDERHAVEQPVEVGEVELGVVGQRDPAQLEVALGGELLPRDDVGVVLELGQHHRVAGSEVGGAPGPGDEVDRLGRVLREHDLVRARGTDETGDLGPGALHGVGRGLGERVRGAVHVRMGRLVVPVHRLDDGGRLLRRRGRVEEHEPSVVDGRRQDGEVGLHRGDVEVVGGGVGGDLLGGGDVGGGGHDTASRSR